MFLCCCVLLGVRITSLTKVVDAMVDNSVTAARVEGVIKGARPVKENYQNEIYSVTLAMPIGGRLMNAVYDKPDETAYAPIPSIPRSNNSWLLDNLNQQVMALENFFVPRVMATESFAVENDAEARAVRRIIDWAAGKDTNAINGGLASALEQFESGQFSGLLVNASSVAGFELATVPQIRDAEGNVIYPNNATSYDDIVNKRGVSYDFDLEDAVRNKRVARVPLVIEALSTYKNLASDLVISKEDAAKILQNTSTRDAMNKAGVLIVVAI